MSKFSLLNHNNVQYVWQANPKHPTFRQCVWEASIQEWPLISVSSKLWQPYIVAATTRWIAQYNRIMAIGVANGESFRDSQRQIFGVDKSTEIHDVARANCVLRGTQYKQTVITDLESHVFDAVFIDCYQSLDTVLEYVLRNHSGPILLLHKKADVIRKLDLQGRQLRFLNKTHDPVKPYHMNQPDYRMQKAHVIAEIIGLATA